MIIFYGDNFELNLTTLRITFVEENALFYDAFFKNYSLPTSLDLDDETSLKLGLIDVENSSGYTVKHKGKLLIDNDFEDAYLQIEVEQQNIEATLYFGKVNLPLMDTELSALPFPLISNSNLLTYANAILGKNYPEVSHCFPMVFDDEFHKESNYDAFEGLVNQHNGTQYKVNAIGGGGEILNYNIMVPFPFLMEVLKVGFKTANLQMIGDFINNKANNHILLDPKKHLERFSSTTYVNHQFSQTTDEYYDHDILIYEYVKTFVMNSIGSFTVKSLLNFPDEVTARSLVIKRGTEVIFTGVGNTIDESVSISKQDINSETITVTMIIEATAVNVEQYNNIEYSKGEGYSNIYKGTYSLAEIMPDMTFGQLLSKVKNWLNLKVIINKAFVRMDYVEQAFVEADFKNETAFEMDTPKRQFNQAKLYKLKYTNDNYILIDKTGRVHTTTGYREEDIIEIDMNLTVLPVEYRNGVFTAVRSKEDHCFLLNGGLDANNIPVATDSINGNTFLLADVYEKLWKNWLHFRLNSETYTDKFTAHALEQFLINNGRYKYNKKHLYKTIKRTRLSEEQWEYEIESETI